MYKTTDLNVATTSQKQQLRLIFFIKKKSVVVRHPNETENCKYLKKTLNLRDRFPDAGKPSWKLNDVQKPSDPRPHGSFMEWEALNVASLFGALPKNFYALLWSWIYLTGYAVSRADVRKRWKPVDEDRTWNQYEHYPTLHMHSIPVCYISCRGRHVWIRIRNSSQLSQGPWESHVCSCEQSILTALLMSSIIMMDAQTGLGEAEQTQREEVGVTAIKDHKPTCWKRETK